MPARTRLAVVSLTLLALCGCAEPPYPPAIRAGSSCAVCGMSIENARFACEQRVQGSWRPYDSIECLARDATTTHEAFLADYDAQTLHAADSMWVVRGRIDSPMGGGLAAFLTREQADDIAGATEGECLRLAALVGRRPGGTP
jgi:nitrous oxide reductase accessory protein NosL